MTSLDANPLTWRLWSAVLSQIADQLRAAGTHPARAVVLLPYAQLMPLATRLWSRLYPNGFAPRFETTHNWARRLRAFSPGPDDLSLDAGRDLLTAQTLLERAGLAAQRDTLAPALVEAALPLAPLAAAMAPAERNAWLLEQQSQLAPTLELGALALEAGVAQIALAWAATSSYATDVLLDDWVHGTAEGLVVLQGYLPDPLALSLHQRWNAARPGSASLILLSDAAGLAANASPEPPQIALHPARDAEDEAQRAAACVLQHVAAGRTPVALAAIDRVLTRRVRAMLDACQLAMRDENGWKLSTTRAAAQLMVALRACVWQADSDVVLDWLKHAPAQPAALVQRLEQHLRRLGQRTWPRQLGGLKEGADADLAEWFDRVNQQRALLGRSRPLPAWLVALRELLQASGQWAVLSADPAGIQVLQTLQLDEHQQTALADWRGSERRLSLDGFTAWVNTVLEAASYQPDYPVEEQVVILPLSQVLARPFAALVAAGCDEARLPAAPDPAGPWTATQRELLGLPSREQLSAASLQAWQVALTVQQVDILWRGSDTTGEPLLLSPLIQRLRLGVSTADAPTPTPYNAAQWLIPAPDPRITRLVTAAPSQPPQPVGAELPVRQLSASSYDNLRHCPYRFFALNQLALRDSDELDDELDKRDFGQWLHAVLRQFHEGLRDQPTADVAQQRRRLDAAATQVTEAMHLDEGDFLPFATTWPRLRDGYLDWWAAWQAQGQRFHLAELSCDQPHGAQQLIGRLDRVDTVPGQPDVAVLLDYKTESYTKSRQRVSQPTEDTQLAFYAAIWTQTPPESLRAAYLNVSDQDGTRLVELPQVAEVRELLLAGVAHDMERIAAGHPLPALGQAPVCDYCAARGLCRKDFWT